LRKVKILVRIVRNLKQPGTFGIPNGILGDNGTKLFRIHKTESVYDVRANLVALFSVIHIADHSRSDRLQGVVAALA